MRRVAKAPPVLLMLRAQTQAQALPPAW